MRKAWIVARHEFAVTVKRFWFVIATFVLPLALLGIVGLFTWLSHREIQELRRAEQDLPLGLIDRWGELATAEGGFKIKPPFRARFFAEESEARAALQAKTLSAYVIVRHDYLESGRIQAVTARRPTLLTGSMERPLVPAELGTWLVENVLTRVEARRVARAKAPYDLDTLYLDTATGQTSSEDPIETLKRSGVAYAFFILLFVSILTSSGYLLQGMAEEKENRVTEMVLSSVTPTELMLGKLVGLGAAGLLQVFLWVVMGVAGIAALAVQVVLVPGLFFFCLVFYLLGYVLYGSLLLGFGALGTNFRETQQMASIWSTLAVLPVIILIALIEAPQGTLVRVFSFVPFTAPTTMMFRYAIDPKGTPTLDIVLSVVILAAFTAWTVRISARLYRAGLLLYGKRPGVREIWRWLVAAR